MPGSKKRTADQRKRVLDHLEELVRWTRNSSASTRRFILPILERNQTIAREVGNLAAKSKKAWLDLLARTDLLLAEAAPFALADLQKDLGKSKLEQLVVERIFVDMIQLAVLDVKAADHAVPATDGFDRRYHQAHARFLASIKTLAVLKKMIPEGNQLSEADRRRNRHRISSRSKAMREPPNTEQKMDENESSKASKNRLTGRLMPSRN